MEKRDLAPLTGVLFVVLAFVALAVLGGSTPDGDASARKVVSFYTDNDAKEGAAALLFAVSAVPMLCFGASVYRRTRAALAEGSVLPALGFGASVMAATGIVGAAAIHLTLSDYAGDLQPGSVQAINAIDGYFIVPFAVGLVTLVLALGVAAVRSELLPTWLGWVGVILFVVAFTPAAFFAVVLSALWTLSASVLLYLRSGAAAQPGLSLGDASGATSPVS
jgi:hypothetical protein